MPGELSKAAAIVRAAESNEIGYLAVPKTALQLHVETNHAHSLCGLAARRYNKLTAHTLGVWLNRLLGVADVLHLKARAFPNN